MKVLLDENLPHDLRHMLAGHEVFTVVFKGWQGLVNGKLLAAAAKDGFDVLISLDAGLEYEQNLSALPVAVVLLRAASNKIHDIEPLLPRLLEILKSILPRSLTIVD